MNKSLRVIFQIGIRNTSYSANYLPLLLRQNEGMLAREIEKRRTFAIISHPDAGKTTLTEKLLLFGGAIQIAGAVKSNKIKKHATSDFMDIERQRGISVATSVMAFEYQGLKINILDTPGHQDFAEDTYRTLTAVDSVIVVIDVAKGVETQTEKLVNVCRMRNTPIIVFINKLDREGRDAIELLDEIESRIAFQSDDYLLLDKPSGMPVHAGSGQSWGVIDVLRSTRAGQFLELGHRLDQETSGCLLLAKTRPALLHFQDLLVEA